MFVRKKKNKSGSITVQIVDKSSGYKILETIGTSKDIHKIREYCVIAQERIDRDYNRQLDLFSSDYNSDIIEEFLNSLTSDNILPIGPELILGKIFDRIGFNKIPEELFRTLVLTRLIYPGSKLKVVDYLHFYQNKDISVQRIYRFLDRFYNKYKEQAEDIAYEYSKGVLGGKISVVFYDVTTLYFEAEDEDDLRRIGFSKDGKFQCPQIQVGLLVGKDGYPLGYNIFEGNKYEGHTLIPVLKAFENRYNISKPIVIADSGLLSKNNIEILESNNYQYILGARIKNESASLKSEILKKSEYLSNGDSFSMDISGNLRLIISYSDSRAKKDKHNRQRGIMRLNRRIKNGMLTKESINNRGYNKFLVLKNKIEVALDESKIREDERWDGLKGYITNTNLLPSDVINNYKHLWAIERAFRISKTDLRIRPIYHYLKRRIEAHICISFVAYTIYKEFERLLKINNSNLSVKKAIEAIRSIYQITYKIPHTKRTKKKILNMTKEQKEIYNIVYP